MPTRPLRLESYGIFAPPTEEELAQGVDGVVREPAKAPRKKNARPEDTIHVAVAKVLRYAIAPAGDTNSDGVRWVTHVPENKGGKRVFNKKRGTWVNLSGVAARNKGQRPGEPDIEVLAFGGRKHGIELKAPNGTLSKTQKWAHAEMLRAGVPVAICRSVDEVLDALRGWGIPLRASV